jgi:Peptidase family M23/Chitinase class I
MGGKDGAFSTNSGLAAEHIPVILAALREQGITCPSQVAYVLATVHRETSFVNFEEGSTRHQSDSEGFWGRGYVQITHRDAYQRMGRALGIDLENNPDLARQPDVAARILAYGFKNGSFGIRRTIDEMIPCNGQVNYREARRMINDSAQAGNIAQAAQMYYDALTSTSEGLDKATVEGGCGDSNGPVQSTDGYINPLEGKPYRVTSNYGPRHCNFHGREIHSGIDLAIGVGTPVKAAKEGTVIKARQERCGGNVIRLRHPDGNETQYLHLNRFRVQQGSTVQKGQVIGEVGSTGRCTTGPHLHYEFYPGGGSHANPRRTGARF